MLLALLALVLLVTPALAAAPIDGIVYEGKSVPKVALGATRAQVVQAYGDPMQCNDISSIGTYTCTFKAVGGGNVAISFVRSSGFLLPVRYDTVNFIRWSQEVSGWKTTAGVTTKLALENPKAVLKAYPRASVKYNALGQIIQVRDAHLGIQVDWLATGPNGNIGRVSMAIFPPLQITSFR